MRMITWKGQTHSVTEWSRIMDIPAEALRNRFNSGWTIERALTQPVKRRKPRKPAPCGATSLKDCFECKLADCTAPAAIRLDGE